MYRQEKDVPVLQAVEVSTSTNCHGPKNSFRRNGPKKDNRSFSKIVARQHSRDCHFYPQMNQVGWIRQAKVNRIMQQFETLTKEDQAKTLESLLSQLPPFPHRNREIQIDKSLQEVEDTDDYVKLDMISLFVGKGMHHVSEHILSYLDADSLVAAEEVNDEYRQVIYDGMLWKKIIERKVKSDKLWRKICDKRGWMDHLFKPKWELPHTDSFYKQLYANLQSRYQMLELNWKDDSNSNSTFKIHQCRSHMYGGANCVQFDDSILITGFNDSTTKIYSVDTLNHLKTLHGHRGPVLCLQYDDFVILTGSKDATVNVWDAITGELTSTLDRHTDAVYGLRFDTNLLVTCSNDQTVMIWNREGVSSFQHEITLISFGHGLICVDFSSRFIVSGSEDATIKVWNAETRKPCKSLYGHEAEVECLQLRGRHVVSGSCDMSVRVWDVNVGICLKVLEEHEDVVGALRFDDKYIVSGSKGRILVWDFQGCLDPKVRDQYLLLRDIMHQQNFICGLQFDEFKIVSGSKDDTIMVYEFINFDEPREDFEDEVV